MSPIVRTLTDYGNPDSFGSRLRAKRIVPFLGLVEEAYRQRRRARILDIGGTRVYWGIVGREFLAGRNVTILVLNLPGELNEQDDELFRFAEGDACKLSEYEDNSFDIVHSNSVIEHVGDRLRMEAFASEVRRLAPAYFVQTPNYWFPLEPHFVCPAFHWLPERWRAELLKRTGLGQHGRASNVEEALHTVRSIRLLTPREMSTLFPEARIVRERFAFLPKSLMAIRNSC